MLVQLQFLLALNNAYLFALHLYIYQRLEITTFSLCG